MPQLSGFKFFHFVLVIVSILSGCNCSQSSARPDSGEDRASISEEDVIHDDAISILDGDLSDGDTPQEITDRAPFCISDWPSGGAVDALSSLSVEKKVLWTKQPRSVDPYTNEVGDPLYGVHAMVISGDRILFLWGNIVVMMDMSGNQVGGYTDVFQRYIKGYPVGDGEGNFYFSSNTLYKMDKEAKILLKKKIDEENSDLTSNFYTGDMALSPEGVLYFATSDRKLRAFNTKTEQYVWIQPYPDNVFNTGVANVRLGVGDVIIVDNTPIYSRTGLVAGDPYSVDGTPLFLFCGASYEGIFSSQSKYDQNGSLVGSAGFVLDYCGKPKATLPIIPGKIWGMLFGSINRRTVVNQQTLSTKEVVYYLYSETGKQILGPVALNSIGPMLVGSDGTFYSLKKQCTGQDEMTLVAYSQQFDEIWSLNIGPPCEAAMSEASFTKYYLRDNGVLYLTRRSFNANSSINLTAIQTPSAGYANTGKVSFCPMNERNDKWLR